MPLNDESTAPKPGSFEFGLGYSQNAGIVSSIQLSQNNFLGTGNRFSIGLSRNNYSKSVSLNYLDPYFTDSGVSVGYNLSYSDYNRSTTTTADDSTIVENSAPARPGTDFTSTVARCR